MKPDFTSSVNHGLGSLGPPKSSVIQSIQTMKMTEAQKITIINYFSSRPEIVAVYLYGSQISGNIHPESDIDIALLTDHSIQQSSFAEFEIKYTTQLEQRLHQNDCVDIKILSLERSYLYLHEVLSHHQLIVDKNPFTRIDFEVEATKRYLDFKPVIDQYHQFMMNRIHQGTYASR